MTYPQISDGSKSFVYANSRRVLTVVLGHGRAEKSSMRQVNESSTKALINAFVNSSSVDSVERPLRLDVFESAEKFGFGRIVCWSGVLKGESWTRFEGVSWVTESDGRLLDWFEGGSPAVVVEGSRFSATRESIDLYVDRNMFVRSSFRATRSVSRSSISNFESCSTPIAITTP